MGNADDHKLATDFSAVAGSVNVKTFRDVLKAMEGFKKGQIHLLEFRGHGNDDEMWISSPLDSTKFPSATEITVKNAAWIGEQLKESGVLAPDAVIILNGCNTGLSAKGDFKLTPTWPQLLADSSGCFVYAAGGVAWGTFIGKTASVTVHMFLNQTEPMYPATSTTYASTANIYYLFKPR